jgi:hypothetical protein
MINSTAGLGAGVHLFTRRFGIPSLPRRLIYFLPTVDSVFRMGVRKQMQMKSGSLSNLLSLGVILLSGCTGATTGVYGSPSPSASRTPAPTPTETPIPTVTPTATEIPTVVPYVTPSPGPKPELEIFNITIQNDPHVEFIFMAEIRNNSDDLMAFNQREIGMTLFFEQWKDWAGRQSHIISEVPIYPLDGRMNCMLFPGETGVIMFSSRTGGMSDYTKTVDDIEGPLSQRGVRLIGYQGASRYWRDLKELFPFNKPSYGYPDMLENYNHPEAENLVFRIDGARIFIEYEIEIRFPDYGSYDPFSWIILYDSSDRIVNILRTRPIYCEGVGCWDPKRYHLFGIGSNSQVSREPATASAQFTDWWKPFAELTADQLRSVDRIRVLNEIQNEAMCSGILG